MPDKLLADNAPENVPVAAVNPKVKVKSLKVNSSQAPSKQVPTEVISPEPAGASSVQVITEPSVEHHLVLVRVLIWLVVDALPWRLPMNQLAVKSPVKVEEACEIKPPAKVDDCEVEVAQK